MLGLVTASQIASASLPSFLPAFPVGRHELGRHQLHRMPMPLKAPPPVMRSRARLHADQARRQRGHRLGQSIAPHRSPQQRLAGRIHAVQRKHVLCQVDAHSSNLFHDFPSGYLD
jgi:hypothetical protein